MKKIVIAILNWSVKRTLAKHKPTIIAVTGSVGKTSTKDAIAIVLASKFSVRANKKNLNTEVGVPLTILGLEKPTSVFGWAAVVFGAIVQSSSFDKSYPTHLVLEFGADHAGDIKHLVELAPPMVGVVTAITHVHVGNYTSFDALVAEKTELVKHLPSDGLAVLNADDERVLLMREQTNAPVTTYGFGSSANIVGQGYQLRTREDGIFKSNEPLADSTFTVVDRQAEGQSVEVTFKNTVGQHQASVGLAAIAVGKYFGIPLDLAAQALSDGYVSPPGRMKPILGIKGTLLIDDSYNAAPASMAAALETLKDFHPLESARRIAVLGEMAELGNHTEEQHRHIGWKVAEVGVDLLICVGEKSHDTARGAIEAGMHPEQIQEITTATEAGRLMDHEIKKGDIVLIKGSQSSRMERVVKDLLAEPEHAADLLVRQDPEWLAIV